MKQVCPLYRVQFRNGIILAIDSRSLYFLRAPKIHTLKKAGFFCPITRGYLSDYTRIKGVFFVMIYDWKGGIGI